MQQFNRSSTNEEKEKIGIETRAACDQDYSPCYCYVSDVISGIFVECDYVPVATIQDVFQRVNNSDIYNFKLIAPIGLDTIFLPVDFLGNTRVTSNILIVCGGIDGFKFPNLVIDPLAFRFSQSTTTRFSLHTCDLGLQTDFNFLNGFNNLTGLDIYRTNNLTAFRYLPPLISLRFLSITYCSEPHELVFPDLSPAELNSLNLEYSSIDDKMAEEIVASLAASTSIDSLELLNLIGTYLTRIPNQVVSAFTQLKEVYFGHNDILHIPTLSLAFTSPYLKYLMLGDNIVNTIESGAFQGRLYIISLYLFTFNYKYIYFEQKIILHLYFNGSRLGPFDN